MAVDIVLAGDRNILWGLAVTVRSALEASSGTLNIHVLATGFSQKDKDRLRQSWAGKNCGLVNFMDIRHDQIREFRSTKYLKSKSAYSRYYLGLLPESVSRCVYLDTDLLVFKDLQAVSALDLGSNWIAAVRDVSIRTRITWPELRARLGMRDEANYFNSGFLVIDLDAWRRERCEERLIDISLKKFDQLDSQDQDALNILFEDRTSYLDVSWNISQYERPETVEDHVVHLIGSIKPWHSRYSSKLKDPYFKSMIYDRFYEILDRTCFRGARPLQLGGLGAAIEHVGANIPTRDMLTGKLRRSLARIGG